MNLIDQTVSNTNEVNLQDSLNASLLELKVKMEATTVAPIENDLIIYIDKSTSTNPTIDRKLYVFNLEAPLRYYNEVGDELIEQIKIINNDIIMTAFVNRKISNDGNSILLEPVTEELESIPITLFEGENYIYTNYYNADITLIYPKSIDENKVLLNNAIYWNHKVNNVNEFSLDDIYFKDAFTKVEDNLNLEVNNISIDSISSNNDNFSLDSNGNLIVNSITSNDSSSLINEENICNLIYPVGSIYLSVNNTSPATLFGGTWSQIQDRFLLSAGSTYTNGSTGGNAAHTHTVNSHYHNLGDSGLACFDYSSSRITTREISGSGLYTANLYKSVSGSLSSGYSASRDWGTALAGRTEGPTATVSTASSNNLPPYLVIYMWKRTA